MADVLSADKNYTSLGNAQLDSYYQSFIKTLPNQQISYDPVQYQEQTVDSITDAVSGYLRSYYDDAIKQRQAQTVQNNAELDVDAASRGMGSSTFLSDMKNRQYIAESADIAGINSDYNATLAQTVQQQYNDYIANKLNVDFQNRGNQLTVDQWNAQMQLAIEELAYARALDAYKRNPSNGGGSSGGSGSSRGSSVGGNNTNYFLDFTDDGKHLVYRYTDGSGKVVSAVPSGGETKGTNPDTSWMPQTPTKSSTTKTVSPVYKTPKKQVEQSVRW